MSSSDKRSSTSKILKIFSVAISLAGYYISCSMDVNYGLPMTRHIRFQQNAFKLVTQADPNVKHQIYTVNRLMNAGNNAHPLPKVVAVTDIFPKIIFMDGSRYNMIRQYAIGKIELVEAFIDKARWNPLKTFMKENPDTSYVFFSEVIYTNIEAKYVKGTLTSVEDPKLEGHATFFTFYPRKNKVIFVNSHSDFLNNNRSSQRSRIKSVMQHLFHKNTTVTFMKGGQTTEPYCTLHTSKGVADQLRGKSPVPRSNHHPNINKIRGMLKPQLTVERIIKNVGLQPVSKILFGENLPDQYLSDHIFQQNTYYPNKVFSTPLDERNQYIVAILNKVKKNNNFTRKRIL